MVIQFAAEEDDQSVSKRSTIKEPFQRRVTKAVIVPVNVKKKSIKLFKATTKWWQKASITFAFSHPHVTSRLEKLMGSNLVSMTNRDYMQKLQERIIEDYGESMQKRIKVRENAEMERVKNLVLSGRIPLNSAPPCMADHPIMMIEKHCRALIAARRAKIKIPKVHIPRHLYFDDTPDPPSGLSIENGHIFRDGTERLCNPVSRFLPEEIMEDEEVEEMDSQVSVSMQTEIPAPIPEEEEVVAEEEEGEELEEELEFELDSCMFSKEEFAKLKYESPLIKRLRRCKNVEQLYMLADEIIGILQVSPEEEKPKASPSTT